MLATGYGLDDRVSEVRLPARAGIFHFTGSSPAVGRTQPLIQWVPGTSSTR